MANPEGTLTHTQNFGFALPGRLALPAGVKTGLGFQTMAVLQWGVVLRAATHADTAAYPVTGLPPSVPGFTLTLNS